MPSRLLLSRAAAIALRALVELAREPGVTLSVAELARRQQLPRPMLEQILLRLRRAGVVRARRGRQGGYLLAVHAERLPLERVLRAVELSGIGRSLHSGGGSAGHAMQGPGSAPQVGEGPVPQDGASRSPGGRDGPEPRGRVADLQGPPSVLGGAPVGVCVDTEGSLGASAGHRVEEQLRRRLERLLQVELQRLTLAELLYDQRSWEASLGPEGGVILS
ncbi:MAG: Rrf2 family transcriptional regulator [Cyanobium sp.]